jgi:two-component system KDP operon response regulator KdpE
MSLGRVLVVDDEPQIRRVLRSTLAARGYEVRDAPTGEDALESLRHSRFDLVLLDVNMPGMGGLLACREIRAGSAAAIIMLTVSDSEEDKVAALDAGADDYVTKPFGMPELLARIRAALRRLPANPERDQLVAVGELQINFMQRRVIAKDREIRLTPKEFDLLQYLITNPNIFPTPNFCKRFGGRTTAISFNTCEYL